MSTIEEQLSLALSSKKNIKQVLVDNGMNVYTPFSGYSQWISKQFETNKNTVDTLKNNVESLNEQVNNLTTTNSTLQNQIDLLNTTVADKENTITSLNTQLGDLTRVNTELNKAMDNTKTIQLRSLYTLLDLMDRKVIDGDENSEWGMVEVEGSQVNFTRKDVCIRYFVPKWDPSKSDGAKVSILDQLSEDGIYTKNTISLLKMLCSLEGSCTFIEFKDHYKDIYEVSDISHMIDNAISSDLIGLLFS